MNKLWPNETRPPRPVEHQACNRTPAARPGCAGRWHRGGRRARRDPACSSPRSPSSAVNCWCSEQREFAAVSILMSADRRRCQKCRPRFEHPGQPVAPANAGRTLRFQSDVCAPARLRSALPYQVQVSTNLNTPTWNPLGSATAATAATLQYHDAAAQSSPRFYRLIR